MKKLDAGRVRIFDTTLRDGEQSPGASMNQREKLEIAQALASLGVDIIEAGFPVASPGDHDAVKAIAVQVKGPIIAGLARCVEKDIRVCASALEPAEKKRIHVFTSGSDIHLKSMLKITRRENIRRSIQAVGLARNFTDDVEFSAQDTTRSDLKYLATLYRAVADAGATTLNIPDTVGYATPGEYTDLVDHIIKSFRTYGIVFSVHCHNDLGLAVANSLAAVQVGVRQIECAVNGLGERAGNCALEEVVMALHTRGDFYHLTTGIKTQNLCRTSRLVSRLTGIAVQRNKAIVGANAFAHEAGIHQDGILKKRQNYEIMRAEDVGADGTELVLGKHSGRHALGNRLIKIGVRLSDEELDRAYDFFKRLADKKKLIYDDDLITIALEVMGRATSVFELDYLHVSSGTSVIPTATIRLKRDGQVFQDASSGDGPVDAALKVIDCIAKVRGRLLDYSLQAVTIGKDAQGEVSMRVIFGKKRVISAKAASTDIVEASARAYLSCVNCYLAGRKERKMK